MMQLKKMKHMLLFLALATGAAHAQDIRLGNPEYNGSGCPAGSASVSLTDDRKVLSVLFGQYIAEAGQATGRDIDRKSCLLSVPIRIPQGYSVSILEVDYRGFVSIPRGGMGMFNVEYFFAGQAGPRSGRRFTGPMDAPFLIEHNLEIEGMVWSRCGTEEILRINTGAFVRSNRSRDDALVAVDSVDARARLDYLLTWRRCH